MTLQNPPPGTAGTLSTIRKALLIIFVFGLLGTGGELVLLDHTESSWQWVPLFLIVWSLIVLGWHGIQGGPISMRVFQATMIGFIAAGFVGLVLHYGGSVEFKLESHPSLSGWPLFWEAIKTKSPPALAPSIMVELGLLGLAYAYRHPTLIRSAENGTKINGGTP